MTGRYFDEWQIGDTIEHPIRRTVTETDNLLFSTMTHNPQPLHIDAEAARASEFGQILVNGTFTFSLMVGLSVAETTLGTLVANLGYDRLVMPSPFSLAIRCARPARWWSYAPANPAPARVSSPGSTRCSTSATR